MRRSSERILTTHCGSLPRAPEVRRFADVLGRENIIAGVDCGLDTVAGPAQVVPEIAWAKLASLGGGRPSGRLGPVLSRAA
jgi:methionine synthase II (cobalamin-independent)